MNGKPDPLPEIESNHQSKYNENNIVLLNAIASWMLWTSSSVSRDLESNGSVRRYKKRISIINRLSLSLNQKDSKRMTKGIIFWVNQFYLNLKSKSSHKWQR